MSPRVGTIRVGVNFYFAPIATNMAKSFPQRANSMRLPGFDCASEATYYLTICTKDKTIIFTNRERRQLAIDNAKLVSDRLGMILLVCGVMPDHIHLIVHNPGNRRIVVGEFVRQFKSRLYHDLHQKHGIADHLWQRFYYDHIIRNDLDFAEKLDYIVKNPVKAELTAQEADPEYIYLNLPEGGAT